MERQRLRPTILTDLVMGAAAGVAATWLMGKVTTLLYEQEGEQAREREDSARDGKTAYGVAAEKTAALLGRELRSNQRQRYGRGIHWLLGTGAGAVYGLLRERTSWASLGFGTLYGTLFWLVMDEGTNTALGLTPAPDQFPWETHAEDWPGTWSTERRRKPRCSLPRESDRSSPSSRRPRKRGGRT